MNTPTAGNAAILLVQGENGAGEMDTDVLNRHGFALSRVYSADEAVARVGAGGDTALVLIDTDLGEDGFRAAEQILYQQGLPIMFLAGENHEKLLQRLSRIPHYGCVPKEADGPLLAEAIRTALRLYGERSTAQPDRRELEQTRSRLREVEEILASVTDNVPGLIYQFKLNADHHPSFPFMSKSCWDFYGYTAEETMQEATILIDAVHPDDKQAFERRMAESGRSLSLFKSIHRLITRGGAVRWQLAIATPRAGADGSIVWTGIAVDITERIHAEEELEEKKQEVEELLKEKELLLREVHHRIKNDMSTIQSLLSLQSSSADAPETRNALIEAHNRVGLMRHVYEMLYRREGFTEISSGPMLNDLLADIEASSRLGRNVRIVREIADITIAARTAFPLGIVINELVTNALKYAFPDERRGTISIELSQLEERSIRVVVSDDGVGLPAALSERANYGFGLTLVEALAQQHGGSFTLTNEIGAVAAVTLSLSR